jgi:multicomponent Na+:H+ antiporter subunit G
MNALIVLFLVIGTLFNLLGTVALYRFTDVYTRLHGTTKCTTFGSIFTSAAVVLFALQKLVVSGEGRFGTLAVHAIIAVAALLITNPTGAHALARAAHRSGIMPKFAVVDRLAEDQKKKGGVSA